MKMRSLVLASVLSLMSAAAAEAQVDPHAAPVDSLALARQYTAWLYTGGADSLFAHTAPASRESMSRDRYAEATATILRRAGFEVSAEETWKLRNGACQYWRTATMSSMEGGLLVRWVLDAQGRITGLGLGPATHPPAVDAERCE